MVTVAATVDDDPQEQALARFLRDLPDDRAILMRTLAHAWQGGGGSLQVGRWAIRLTAGDGTPFTAGSLHKTRAKQTLRLELCRVILRNHGVRDDDWTHWSDDWVDFQDRGFDRDERFPTLPLVDLSTMETARLAQGLRDLARLCQR